MAKTEQTINEKVVQAVKDVENAMLENIEASKGELDAKTAKEHARFKFNKANERLRAIYSELIQ